MVVQYWHWQNRNVSLNSDKCIVLYIRLLTSCLVNTEDMRCYPNPHTAARVHRRSQLFKVAVPANTDYSANMFPMKSASVSSSSSSPLSTASLTSFCPITWSKSTITWGTDESSRFVSRVCQSGNFTADLPTHDFTTPRTQHYRMIVLPALTNSQCLFKYCTTVQKLQCHARIMQPTHMLEAWHACICWLTTCRSIRV